MHNSKIGVTLGKYIPFHMGHESIIRQMYSDGMDKIIVCVYDCPEYGIDTATRASWIREIFSALDNLTVVEFENSPQEVGYTKDIMKRQEDFFEREMLRKGIDPSLITHFYNSEPYGEHMSKRFGWNDVRVDLNRDGVQVSATKIRNNGNDYFRFLHPIVQNDMPMIITLLGGESTGKTTLGKYLKEEFNFGYIPEYGAEYWYENNKDGVLDKTDLFNIMKEHNIRRNKAISMADKNIYIEDTNNLTTWMFGNQYGILPYEPSIDVVNQFKQTRLFVLCDNDIPFDSSGGRISDEVRSKFNTQYLDFLNRYNLPYIVVSGSVQERALQLANYLNLN